MASWLPWLHGLADALVGAALLVVVEWALATWSGRTEFVGPWELRAGLVRLAPLAWLATLPAALVGAGVLGLGRSRRRAPHALAGAVALLGASAVGVAVTGGRHFASLPWRVGFVLMLGGAAFVVTSRGLARVVRAIDRAPAAAAALALVVALVIEVVNVRTLPRLYPGFHWALVVLAAMLSPVWGRILPPEELAGRGSTAIPWRLLVLAVPFWAAGKAMGNARALSLADNVRFIFIERAPIMRLGVELAARLAPPPPLDGVTPPRPGADERLHLDWRADDILLISVDALRADHVGAYGYQRGTTPHLDALAREGTLFQRAYCPTPHTSYSVTSMMTGKNMRPLLLQGLGSESDTAAGLLRTYGYRSAAFYPPAVFFIDESSFVRYRDRRLDFEYARIEFASPSERAEGLRQYVSSQPPGRRLFVWVHLFEPHEPYVAHPAHPFGDRDIDRYDSEIATADEGIGELVAIMRARSPHTAVIVTADHGEEFGEHQGRYHGTTVYEEQVRVPLIISARGVAAGRRVEAPVQTIDLLPTMLAALDIPRPPRVRGNELSGWLRASAPRDDATGTDPALRDPGAVQAVTLPAFAETDEQTLLAQDALRLVCARRVSACALYDLARDPEERHDASSALPAQFASMRATLARIEASHGAYETAPGARPWPEALRRGMSGDGDAALEVANLLDDSDVAFRRKAAEVLFDLRSKSTIPQLELALSRDDDPVVRRFTTLALTRLGERPARAIELLEDPDPVVRRLAALALAENGDDRGSAVLVAWWRDAPPPSLGRARELLAALGAVAAKSAVPSLIDALADVRLRPYVAATLAELGQSSARAPVARYWASERFQTARLALGDALVRLGGKREIVAPLVRFLGTPDPLPGGLALAERAGVFEQVGGGRSAQLAALRDRAGGNEGTLVSFAVPAGGKGTGLRVLVRAHVVGAASAQLRLRPGAALDGGESRILALSFTESESVERYADLPHELGREAGGEVRLIADAGAGLVVEAMAVVPLDDELPPPAPVPWTPPESESPVAPGAAPH